ncbi:BMP family ABC transporter substrate-binding protein [Treponema sp. OMZ 840]|uniref:BMP family ABC transporter substrate-binding protein n=1 Tax=Treponema sp. OMZ 840 TaxID=244313 RepID=UPI003D92398C
MKDKKIGCIIFCRFSAVHLLTLLSICTLLLAACTTTEVGTPKAHTGSLYAGADGSEYTVAVDFRLKSKFSENDAQLCALTHKYFTAGIKKYSAITLVERADLNMITQVQKESEQAFFDENDALILGKLKNAKYLILGDLTNIGQKYNLSVKVVNVETAVVEGMFSKNYSYAQIESHIAACEALLELFNALSVKLTPNGKQNLITAIDIAHAQIAEENNDTAAAMGFYTKAFNKNGNKQTLKKIQALQRAKKVDWISVQLQIKNFMHNEFAVYTYVPRPEMSGENFITLTYYVSVFPDKAALDTYTELKNQAAKTDGSLGWEDSFFFPDYEINFALYNADGKHLGSAVRYYEASHIKPPAVPLTQTELRKFYERYYKIVFTGIPKESLYETDIFIDKITLVNNKEKKSIIASPVRMLTENEYKDLFRQDIKKTEKKQNKAFTAAMISNGTNIDDAWFDRPVWEGLKLAEKGLGIKTQYVISGNDRKTNNTSLEKLLKNGCDMVFCPDRFSDIVLEFQSQYPGTKFIIFHTAKPENFPSEDFKDGQNVTHIIFSEAEAAFLAGAAAALHVQKGSFGFIGWAQDWFSDAQYDKGWQQGIRYANDCLGTNIEINQENIVYRNDYPDIQERYIAQTLYERGVNVIFSCYDFVINEAKTNNRAGKTAWTVGFYYDKYFAGSVSENSSVILTSAITDFTRVCFDIIQGELRGIFKGGDIFYLGVPYTGLPENNPNLSLEIQKQVYEIARKIKAEEIVIDYE